jgi:hypothetical protein
VSSGTEAADLLVNNGFSLFGWDLEWTHDPHTGKPIGTFGSVDFLLAATLYQGNPDRNHKLWNMVSTESYILHMQVLLE